MSPIETDPRHGVLVTGGAGWVGRYLVKRLVHSRTAPIYLLLRPSASLSIQTRVKSLAEFCGCDIDRFSLLSTDASVPNSLPAEIEFIINAAAQVHFGGTNDIFDSNVGLLWKLLHAANASGRVRRFLHVSTNSIRTNARGPFRESDLDSGQEFVSPYDLTKYLAEQLVEKFYLKVPITVIRLGSVLATTEGVFPHTRDWFFQTIRLWLRHGVDTLPLGEDQRITPIPVDTLAHSLCELIKVEDLPRVLNVPCLPGPSMKEIFEQMSDGTRHPQPRLVAQHEESWLAAREQMNPIVRGLIDRLYPPPPPGQVLASIDAAASYSWMIEHGLNPSEIPQGYWARLAKSVFDKGGYEGSEK